MCKRLLAIDQGADDRGSRPVGDAPDVLFEIKTGAWYGWPDFIAGAPITDDRFRPRRGPARRFLLANHNELPPPESLLVEFPPHSAAVKFAIVPPEHPSEGQLVVALFGDERHMTVPGGPAEGRALVASAGHCKWAATNLSGTWAMRRPSTATTSSPVQEQPVHLQTMRSEKVAEGLTFPASAYGSIGTRTRAVNGWRI